MNADDALLLPADEIDYSALDDTVLFDLAIQEYEPFIATNALTELSVRGSTMAADAAERVAASAQADPHTAAHALTIMFSWVPSRTVERMRTMLEDCADHRLLGAMVENVMSDLERFKPGSKDCDFAQSLAQRVGEISISKFSDSEEVAQFLSWASSSTRM